MDCPFCTCPEYTERPRTALSFWAPLALIVAVLLTAALACALTDTRGDSPARVIAAQGRAL